jgi:hypothetical protein
MLMVWFITLMLSLGAGDALRLCPEAVDVHQARYAQKGWAHPGRTLERLAVCSATCLSARTHGIEADLAVAMVFVESKMLCDAVSSAGCIGPAQIQPKVFCNPDRPGGDPAHCAGCFAQLDRGVSHLAELRATKDRITALCIYATGRTRGCSESAFSFGGSKLYSLVTLELRQRLKRRWRSPG